MSETPQNPDMTKLLIDLGPLVVFILTFVISKNPFTATTAFMVAMAMAMIYAKIKFGSIPILLIMSGIMVLVFGGLTIYLHNMTFIKMKPSIYYIFVSVILFYGVYSNKPLLKHAIGDAYPEMSDNGWHLLGRNFAWLFLILALTNAIIAYKFSDLIWGWSKLATFFATLIFGALNIPMIMRHSGGGE